MTFRSRVRAKVRARVASTGRKVFERLPATARNGYRRRRDAFRGLVQLKRNQAMLARRVADLELLHHGGPPPCREPPDPRFPAGIRSRTCTQAQLREAWYPAWCAALGEPPRAHRKLWERTYIAHVLDSLGMLSPGRRGVGFGVGREPLVALFAARGCEILATDLPPHCEEARAWSNAWQHGGLEGLMRPALCPPRRFGQLVATRPVDMRSLPADLSGFDFCWSACALEHLGSLDAGMEFVEASLRTLAPGGIAVHTTEFNVGSNDATITSGPTVLYRRRDLEELAGRLESLGHEVAALALDPGREVLDEYVAVPPYVEEPHLSVWLKGFTTTTVALVIRTRRR